MPTVRDIRAKAGDEPITMLTAYDAVKIESSDHTIELPVRLTDLGVPVMVHVGLAPERQPDGLPPAR